jgi:hypothetical protein
MFKLTPIIIGIVALSFVSTAALAGEQWNVPKVKKSKFKTSGITKLLKDVDKINETFDGATADFWEATELFQSVINPYTDGKMPLLTKNWKVIKQMGVDAKDQAEKQTALDLRNGYVKEMEVRRKFLEGMMGDPAGTMKLKTSFNTDDIKTLGAVQKLLKKVVTTDKKVLGMVPGSAKKIPGEITKLGKQVTKDPLKAGDYKKLISKLKVGQKKLGEIPPEAGRQTKAADSMTGSITKLLAAEVVK